MGLRGLGFIEAETTTTELDRVRETRTFYRGSYDGVPGFTVEVLRTVPKTTRPPSAAWQINAYVHPPDQMSEDDESYVELRGKLKGWWMHRDRYVVAGMKIPAGQSVWSNDEVIEMRNRSDRDIAWVQLERMTVRGLRKRDVERWNQHGEAVSIAWKFDGGELQVNTVLPPSLDTDASIVFEFTPQYTWTARIE